MSETEVHISVVRKALRDGNAAVMVGAGFSRNAEGGDQLKTWPEIARALWRELNPGRPEPIEFLGAQGPQLGEQFVRVFSTPGLEDLLKRLVPDERIRPGRLHGRLLELPWSDIFTTNYDTLLERAADKVLDRAHYTITCREDIPQSKILNRRRIVKLHGSFPSQRPFIFTEEDYRRYPAAFAPFVNLVRQSLLENVFCLVGFSGDDPNFLHWIGWIRDMLDQHALPIYLFVPEVPTLGQSALLQSRRVTPVVLPMPDGVDAADFASRFHALFDRLEPRNDTTEAAWASVLNRGSGEVYATARLGEGIAALAAQFGELRTLRDGYPGWLVAPRDARRDMTNALHGLAIELDRRDLYKYLEDDRTLTAIVLLEQYVWQQDVLLQCMDDQLAETANALLRKIANGKLASMFENEAPFLATFGVVSLRAVIRCIRDLIGGLLRWARQEFRTAEFGALEALVTTMFSQDVDLQADLYLENVLFALYEGDIDVARRLLLDWDVSAVEPYTAVRRGALLAEVGEVELGLVFCIDALRRLRQNQKVRSDATRYLSEEAWACRVIGNLQRSKLSVWGAEVKEDDHRLSDEIDRRLLQLAAKGHDVRQQMNELITDLEVDAPLQAKSRYRMIGFDAGHYIPSTRFGFSSGEQTKIRAAFAWLTLVDRVGLTPRVGNATFDMHTYLQAGWWIQFYDTPQRMLSVAIRAQSKEALGPRDSAKPAHHTGWLSRIAVARLDTELATRMSERSLGLVERILASDLPDEECERIAAFHLEVVSRLIVPMTDSRLTTALVFRTIELHSTPRFRRLESVWKAAAYVISRGMSCLDAGNWLPLIGALVRIPLLPNETELVHHLSDWILFHRIELSTRSNEDPWGMDLDDAVRQLVDAAMDETDAVPGSHALLRRERAWERLYWLDSHGLLSTEQRNRIGRTLWRKGDEWPRIPGHVLWAANRWPAPRGIDKRRSFRRWSLGREVPSFRTAGGFTITPAGGTVGWGFPVQNGLLVGWVQSLKERRWPRADFMAALSLVRAWWDAEWSAIQVDAPGTVELLDEVVTRFELLDQLFEMAIAEANAPKVKADWPLMLAWMGEAIRSAQSVTQGFWRTRRAQAMARGDQLAWRAVQDEMGTALLDTTRSRQSYVAARTLSGWVKEANTGDAFRPDGVLDVLISLMAGTSVPGLSWALPLITNVLKVRPEWMSEAQIRLLELGLAPLRNALTYEVRALSRIPEDEIPALRQSSAAFCLAWRHAFPDRSVASISAWIVELCVDPLPEVRRTALANA